MLLDYGSGECLVKKKKKKKSAGWIDLVVSLPCEVMFRKLRVQNNPNIHIASPPPPFSLTQDEK